MSYTKHNFVNGQKLNAQPLNEMEDGIVANETEIAKNKDTLTELNTAIQNNQFVVLDNNFYKAGYDRTQITESSTRCLCVFPLGDVSGVIKFDNTTVYANYFIVDKDTLANKYTPNAWNQTGELPFDKKNYTNSSLLVIFKRPNDGNFNDEIVASVNKTTRVIFNNPNFDGINAELETINSNIDDLDTRVTALESEEQKEVTELLNFSQGGYAVGQGIIDYPQRAYCITTVKADMHLKYDGSFINLNYYIVNSESQIVPHSYTPNTWNSSGDITISADYIGKGIVILAKKVDGGEFTPTVLNSMNVKATFKGGITVDLFMFMGQSNMAGRGISNTSHPEVAPTVIDGAGYEFRAISDSTKLNPIVEPFGRNENNASGIDDGTMKTGSMVSAFVNAYYSNTKVPVVGVSASKGGSYIAQWLPNAAENYLNDAISRLNSCVTFLLTNGYTIRNKFVLWCQGESDGDRNTSKDTYVSDLQTVIDTLKNSGIDKVFMVRIGNCNVSGSLDRYVNMIGWQNEIAQTNSDVVMVSCDFAGMRERGLMKDDFHYYQQGYNECGKYAGINTALYVNTDKEPTMYDTQNNNLYYSHKN